MLLMDIGKYLEEQKVMEMFMMKVEIDWEEQIVMEKFMIAMDIERGDQTMMFLKIEMDIKWEDKKMGL